MPQEDREATEDLVIAVVTKLMTLKFGEAAKLVEQGAAETLSYYAFPSQHCRNHQNGMHEKPWLGAGTYQQ